MLCTVMHVYEFRKKGFTADSHPAAGGTVACADRVVYIDLLTTKRKPGGSRSGENADEKCAGHID